MCIGIVGRDAQCAINEFGGLAESAQFFQDKAEIDQGVAMQWIRLQNEPIPAFCFTKLAELQMNIAAFLDEFMRLWVWDAVLGLGHRIRFRLEIIGSARGTRMLVVCIVDI